MISRCLKSPTFDVCSLKLHMFCNASNLDYGAVSYIRSVTDNGEVLVVFVMGKSRVSPARPISVPRLELTAAIVCVKMSKFIQCELGYKFNRIVYWTDFTTVLHYIQNESSRLKCLWLIEWILYTNFQKFRSGDMLTPSKIPLTLLHVG